MIAYFNGFIISDKSDNNTGPVERSPTSRTCCSTDEGTWEEIAATGCEGFAATGHDIGEP